MITEETKQRAPNNPMVVGALDESVDESRLDALFSSQVQKDRSGKFSLQKYS